MKSGCDGARGAEHVGRPLRDRVVAELGTAGRTPLARSPCEPGIRIEGRAQVLEPSLLLAVTDGGDDQNVACARRGNVEHARRLLALARELFLAVVEKVRR